MLLNVEVFPYWKKKDLAVCSSLNDVILTVKLVIQCEN